jgi:membrane protease YdiL (CAAX protease family)
VYVLAISAGELVTTYVNPMYGIICHVLLLIGLLVHAALTFREKINVVYSTLGLVPLIRIMSLTMPLVRVPPICWYLVISVPLFAATASVVRLAGFKSRDIGLIVGNLPLQITIGLLGVPLSFMEYQILKPSPLAGEMTVQRLWLPALVLLLSTGFLEELIFRGVIFRAVVIAYGSIFATLYTSFIFAILHTFHRSLEDLVFVFVVALIFSVIAGSSRSILGVSLAHGLTNIGLYLIWPFLS